MRFIKRVRSLIKPPLALNNSLRSNCSPSTGSSGSRDKAFPKLASMRASITRQAMFTSPRGHRIRFYPCPACLREPPCLQRIDLNQWELPRKRAFKPPVIWARRLKHDTGGHIATQPRRKCAESAKTVRKGCCIPITQPMRIKEVFGDIYAYAIICHHRHVLCLSCKPTSLRIRSGLMRRRRLIVLKNGPS